MQLSLPSPLTEAPLSGIKGGFDPEFGLGLTQPPIAEIKQMSAPARGKKEGFVRTSSGPDLKKPVETVVIQPKKGKVTLQARRFFNVLLSHAQDSPTPLTGQYYQIPLAKFLSDSAFESRNIAYVVDVLNSMMATVVNWGDTPEKFQGKTARWKGAPLLAYAELAKTPAGTTLSYDFQAELRKELLAPQAYARISLAMNAKLRTHAALMLYELGERYLTNPGGASKKLPWRDWVGPITGNPLLAETAEYKYFARDVLKPALTEVNKAQQKFKLVAKSTSVHRRVEFLQFEAVRVPDAERRSGSVPLAGIEISNLPLIGRMLQLGIQQQKAEDYLSRTAAVRVQAALDYVQAKILNSKIPVQNPSAYFKKIIEDADLSAYIDAPSREVKSDQATPIPGLEVTQELTKKYREAVKKKARAAFENGTDLEKSQYLDDFERAMLPTWGETFKQTWLKFRAGAVGATKMSEFVAHPFIEWLASAQLNVGPDVVYQWGVDSGALQLRCA